MSLNIKLRYVNTTHICTVRWSSFNCTIEQLNIFHFIVCMLKTFGGNLDLDGKIIQVNI